MVQKIKKPASPDAVAPKRRGRPRAYQPEIALGKALDLFRKDGFAATSLDDLSAATGMNRPSLYGAFGDKRELYIKSYARYRADARAAMIDIFRDELPIRRRLERIFAVALDIYLSGDAGPRGCFTVMTAASEAVSDPGERRTAANSRSRGARAIGIRDHPQHCRPRPRARAAEGAGSDREGGDRCDGARLVPTWSRLPVRNCAPGGDTDI